MARVTIGFGVVLIVLGVGFYFDTEMKSVTALIPTFLGAVLLLLGILGLKDNLRKHAMHTAVLLALLGAIGSGARLAMGTGTFGKAQTEQLILVVLCLAYVALGVRSFIMARRARAGRAES